MRQVEAFGAGRGAWGAGARHLLDAAPSGAQPEAEPGFIVGIFLNSPFFVAALCFAVSQLTKFILNYLETKELHWERLWGSGGMPSAHSAFVVGLTTAVGIREGTNSSVFAVSLVLALIVMYDAVGVRLHAGHQAVALNAIISELPSTHPMLQAAAMNGNTENGRTFLREKLGHTPAQVAAGSGVGFVIALLFHGVLHVATKGG